MIRKGYPPILQTCQKQLIKLQFFGLLATDLRIDIPSLIKRLLSFDHPKRPYNHLHILREIYNQKRFHITPQYHLIEQFQRSDSDLETEMVGDDIYKSCDCLASDAGLAILEHFAKWIGVV